MSTATDPYRNAASSTERQAAGGGARTIGDQAGDIATNAANAAGQQFSRAQDMAADAIDDAGEAIRRNPFGAMAISLGVGFLLGLFTGARR
jgi:ElaB/YqjD/DUF883 family membrane-anchored ribosome-binding protein